MNGNSGNYYNNGYGNGTQNNNTGYRAGQAIQNNRQENYNQNGQRKNNNPYQGNGNTYNEMGYSENRQGNNNQNNNMGGRRDTGNTGENRNPYEINMYAVRTRNGCSVTGYVFPNQNNEGPLAYCSICINNLIVIQDVRLMARNNDSQWFLSMPSRNVNGRWKDVAFIMNPEMVKDIEDAICEKYCFLMGRR